LRIVVTRAESQADPLVARLEALGHEVVRCPLIRIEPLNDEPVDPSGYDWVVVTSPNGAAELARRLSAPPAGIAAIGPGTAEALAAHGLRADLVPRVATQEGLLAELPPGRVLLAAAEGARRLLGEERDADFVPLYRTVELQPPAPSGDLVLLASPSAVRAFAATGARIPAVAMGPQTAAEAVAQGLELVAVAESHDVEGLLEAVSSLSH
jgi:uroporphyrinogen III methyltransferase/synthase